MIDLLVYLNVKLLSVNPVISPIPCFTGNLKISEVIKAFEMTGWQILSSALQFCPHYQRRWISRKGREIFLTSDL
jgi:hypothetical protein